MSTRVVRSKKVSGDGALQRLMLLSLIFLICGMQEVSATTKELSDKQNEAVIGIRQGNFELAIEKLTVILKADPKYAIARANLATAYNNLGIHESRQPKQALSAFEHALYISPGHLDVEKNLAQSIRELGFKPESFEDRVKLADQSLARKDYVGAIVELREALRIKHVESVSQKLHAIPKPTDLPYFDEKPINLTNGSSVSISNANGVDYHDYMQNMQMLIRSKWNPPRPALPIAKRVQLAFKINKDGSCSDVYVLNPSPETTLLDDSCIQAVSQTKLNPLPARSAEYVNVQFTFDYNKSKGYYPVKTSRSTWSITPSTNTENSQPSLSAAQSKQIPDLPKTADASSRAVSKTDARITNEMEVQVALDKPETKVTDVSQNTAKAAIVTHSDASSQSGSIPTSFEFEGTARSVSDCSSGSISIHLAELGNGRFISSGRLESGNFSGQFFNVPGRVLASAKNLSSLQFSGNIETVTNGSARTKSEFVMTIGFTETAVDGVFKIGDSKGSGVEQTGILKLNPGRVPGSL